MPSSMPKEYHRQYNKKWRKQNQDKTKANADKYLEKKKDDPQYYLKKIYRERRRVAKQKGIPFDILFEDIGEVPTHCPILGIKLKHGDYQTSPSLDKIDPTKGYVKGNVHWISFRANRLKADATVEELCLLLEWMKNRKL
jgi:hypothetical protein